MSNYSQIVSFAPKDALLTGNPAKLIKGSEIDPELSAISGAIATKLDSATLAGEVATQAIVVNTNSPTASTLGFRGVPQNSQSDNYTAALTDMGKHLLHPSGGGSGDSFTIPSNAAVPFPLGATLSFVNLDTNSVNITITSDNLLLAGTTLTGSRSLGHNGMATAVKVAATTWLIGGIGLS